MASVRQRRTNEEKKKKNVGFWRVCVSASRRHCWKWFSNIESDNTILVVNFCSYWSRRIFLSRSVIIRTYVTYTHSTDRLLTSELYKIWKKIKNTNFVHSAWNRVFRQRKRRQRRRRLTEPTIRRSERRRRKEKEKKKKRKLWIGNYTNRRLALRCDRQEATNTHPNVFVLRHFYMIINSVWKRRENKFRSRNWTKVFLLKVELAKQRLDVWALARSI